MMKRAVLSHIGLNPVAQKRMLVGGVEVELVPQGTPVKRIRVGVVGLGGVLAAKGISTPQN